ncbi:MAG: tetratricopeptide (TPR) repeat protein [Kiritimatiellia bacterium]|jgi:tetratricopeptide (TPR) repeat protein
MLAIQKTVTDPLFMTLAELLTQAENAHRKGELDEAENTYQAILKKEQNIDALFGLATLSHQTKRYEEANRLFAQALSYEPNAFDINFNALLCLVDSGQIEVAKTKFQFILTIAPKHSDINGQLAALALRLGFPDQALTLLSSSGSLSPQSKSIKLQALMKTEQSGKALVFSQSLIDVHPDDPALLSLHAICQIKMQLNTQAVETYNHLVKLLPNNSLLHIKFADLYLLVHESKLARQQLNIAIELNDESIMRFEVESKVCRIEDNKKQALIAADNALKIKPEAEFAWHVKQDLGDEEQCLICINELSRLTTSAQSYSYDLQHNLYTLAKAHQRMTDYKQAFENFDRANNLQTEKLSTLTKQYSSGQTERDYKKLASIPYPVQSIEDYTDKDCHNFFIVGMPRTGTTLMNRVLSQHADFESCGESNAIATLFENILLNSKLSEDAIVSKLSDSKVEFQNSYRQFNRSFLPNVVDKMPHNFRYVGAILATFPNCRIIQMRRELRDLALSIYSNFFNQQHTYSCNLQNIVHAVYQANKIMDFWAKSFPKQVIDVQYEDLVVEPKKQFQRLFDFCNLAWNDDYLSFHKQVVASFTFSESQVRQPINTSKLGFSKHYEKQLQIVYETHALLLKES